MSASSSIRPTAGLEGELRLVGLFTSGAYTRSARQIPYVRHKVAQVLKRAGFDPDSQLRQGRSAYPRRISA